MTMHLLPVYYTTTKYKRKKKKNSTKLSTHDQWLLERGVHPEQLKAKINKEHLKKDFLEKVEQQRINKPLYVSAGMNGDSSSTANRSIMNKLQNEPEHVRKEIIAKSKRVAIAYNKGAYQYITDGADTTDIGKKK